MPMHALVEVTQQAVIVNTRGQILIVRRPIGKWQFAGGRLEVNERWDEGLRREVRDETGIDDLQIGIVLEVDNWVWEGVPQYGVFFVCRTQTERIVLSDEHDQYLWLSSADDLSLIDFWHPRLRILTERVFHEYCRQ